MSNEWNSTQRGRGGGRGGRGHHHHAHPSKDVNQAREQQRDRELASAALRCQYSNLSSFEEVDPFNRGNVLTGFFSREENDMFGSIFITHVNHKRLEEAQVIYGTPKMNLPWETPARDRFRALPPHASFLLCQKWNGVNVIAYKYSSVEGQWFVTFKTRTYPFLRDSVGVHVRSIFFPSAQATQQLQQQCPQQEQLQAACSPPQAPAQSSEAPPVQSPLPADLITAAAAAAAAAASASSQESQNPVTLSPPSQPQAQAQSQSPAVPAGEPSVSSPPTPPVFCPSLIVDERTLPPLLSRLANRKLQSISFELCGSDEPHLVRYDFAIALKPLFFTSHEGRIYPIHNPENDVLGPIPAITPRDQHAANLESACRSQLQADMQANEAHRQRFSLTPRTVWFGHYAVEGKVLYLLDSNGALVHRDALFKIKPPELDHVHSEVADAPVHALLFDAVGRVLADGRPLDETAVARAMGLAPRQWQRHRSALQPLLVGLPLPGVLVPADVRRVLVLVGLPGSGKSTAATRLAQQGWVRVNQDELGSRRACEIRAEEALRLGRSVVVDRCNFDFAQRHVWVAMAAQYRVSRIDAMYFDVPAHVCVQRVSVREDHPTIPKGDKGGEIVSKFSNLLFPPRHAEGFSQILVVRSPDEVDSAVATLVVAAPPLSPPTPASPASPSASQSSSTSSSSGVPGSSTPDSSPASPVVLSSPPSSSESVLSPATSSPADLSGPSSLLASPALKKDSQ